MPGIVVVRAVCAVLTAFFIRVLTVRVSIVIVACNTAVGRGGMWECGWQQYRGCQCR
jgi:hypothetical protein